jgi:hypothetical protein
LSIDDYLIGMAAAMAAAPAERLSAATTRPHGFGAHSLWRRQALHSQIEWHTSEPSHAALQREPKESTYEDHRD